jgi:hypothetical protein
MTIKQQGGVFGRNPTFNDVDVDGYLDVDGGTLYVNPTNNRVGINTTTPSTTAHVKSGIYNHFIGDGTLITGANFSADSTVAYGTTAYASLGFYTWNQQRGRFTPEGDLQLNTGNLIVPNGKGIDFSATSGTGTSELFDDYEEGTWTATVGCTGNATETTTATAYYTKVGRQVTVSFRTLNNIDTTGFSGFLLIKGLPYACVSGATAGFSGSVIFKALTYPANTDAIFPTTANGSSTIIFELMGDGASPTFLLPGAITSGTTDIAYLTLTYFTT